MSEWTSVKDKLPRVRKSGFSNYVLTYGGGYSHVSARLQNGEWTTVWGTKAGPVTHWQSLPNPPEVNDGQTD